jgi:subtilisin family serine protease
VAALKHDLSRAGFSNYGFTSNEGIMAPGVDILIANLTHPTGLGCIFEDYVYDSGTSYAYPMVSGVCALILSASDNIRSLSGVSRVDAIEECLYNSATLVGGQTD